MINNWYWNNKRWFKKKSSTINKIQLSVFERTAKRKFRAEKLAFAGEQVPTAVFAGQRRLLWGLQSLRYWTLPTRGLQSKLTVHRCTRWRPTGLPVSKWTTLNMPSGKMRPIRGSTIPILSKISIQLRLMMIRLSQFWNTVQVFIFILRTRFVLFS